MRRCHVLWIGICVALAGACDLPTADPILSAPTLIQPRNDARIPTTDDMVEFKFLGGEGRIHNYDLHIDGKVFAKIPADDDPQHIYALAIPIASWLGHDAVHWRIDAQNAMMRMPSNSRVMMRERSAPFPPQASVSDCTIDGVSKDSLTPPIPAGSIQPFHDELYAIARQTGGDFYRTLGLNTDFARIIWQTVGCHDAEHTDVAFVLDVTGSMIPRISNLNDMFGYIVDPMEAVLNLKLAGAKFGDKRDRPMSWYEWLDFQDDPAVVGNFLTDLKPMGGGSTPESIYDALHETLRKLQWRQEAHKVILLITDSYPLTGNMTDASPDDVLTLLHLVDIELNVLLL